LAQTIGYGEIPRLGRPDDTTMPLLIMMRKNRC
jgi:hypothetical protein